jgi:opacity protein-like surface antigen
MNINVTSVVLGLGLAVGLASQAAAGGSYSDIGIKTHRDVPAAVPVPAPVPIPVGPASWYLRADIGYGIASKPGLTQSGLIFGQTDSPGPANAVASPVPFGADSSYGSSWFDSDFDTFVSGGIGAGYNWGRGFRTDITAELRSKHKVTGGGKYSYAQYEMTANPPPAVDTWQANGSTVNGSFTDTTTVDTTVFMFNGYYDLTRWSAFTPYVGAGVGISYNTIERDHRWVQTDGTTDVNVQDRLKTHNYGLVLSATAGLSYEFTQSILLDLNYRFLWMQGMNIDLPTAGTGISRLAIADYGEHAIRTGLRFNMD